MDDNKDYIKLIQFYLNKFFYSYLFPIVFLILLFIIYLFKSFDLLPLIILYVFILFLWFIKLTFIPKNKSKKYGIVFFINNGEYYNENVSSMFEKIKFTLQDEFKIFVFNNNFIWRIVNKKGDEVFFKKGYHMIINFFSLLGKENSENVCSITNKNITFVTPVPIDDKNLIDCLTRDFNLGFKKIIKLTEKNSYVDINNNADLLSLSIRYFVSIIYIIFRKIDFAEKELNYMDFSTVDPKDKIVQYLRRSVLRRHIDICHIKIFDILVKKEYLNNLDVLNELSELTNEFGKMVESDSGFSDLRYILNDIKSKIYFCRGDYANSERCLNMMKKKNPGDYIMLLSLAFIQINKCNILGFEIYKKLSKRKDIDFSIIKECKEFIEKSLNCSIHNPGLLMLCDGILEYYWFDSSLGLGMIKNSLQNINDDNIKKYVESRFFH